MALIKCTECGQQISDEAKRCPSCGAKVKKPASFLWWVLGAMVVYGVVSGAMNPSETPPQKTEAEKQAEAEASQKLGLDIARTKALKQSTKNPASFELVEAIRMDDLALCITYRGTNSFNAVVTENKVLLKDWKTGEWNKSCSGKTGADVTKKVQRAL
jgi:hypothetical protein